MGGMVYWGGGLQTALSSISLSLASPAASGNRESLGLGDWVTVAAPGLTSVTCPCSPSCGEAIPGGGEAIHHQGSSIGLNEGRQGQHWCTLGQVGGGRGITNCGDTGAGLD